MLAYDPSPSPARALDPRAKLAFQVGFAAAAFAHTTPRGLAALSAVAVVALAAARLSPPRAVWELRALLPFLVVAPAVEALRPGPPWVAPAAAAGPLLASYRVLLVVLVGAAYVRSTPARESRAAIQRTVPGRPGRMLGLGVALVFRFLPVLRADLRRLRRAQAARLGGRRSAVDRARLLAVTGTVRALGRADRLSAALRVRCLSWNPTPPPLRFGPADWATLAAAAALATTVAL